MHKFLDIYTSRSYWEDILYWKRPTIDNKTEAIKFFSTKKCPGPDEFINVFYLDFKEKPVSILLNGSMKQKGEENCQIHL